jgi:type IV pilus assembly protein PilW
MSMRATPWRKRRQRGLSLVELMVGITIGMFVVAAAAMLVGSQLADNRRLLLETQLQQDLRAAADNITRQVRRAGITLNTLALNGGDSSAGSNAGGAWQTDAVVTVEAGPVGSRVNFNYYVAQFFKGAFGFQLATNGVLQSNQQVPTAGWQAMTDQNTVNVTAFTVTPKFVTTGVLACPKLCADGTASCWPTLEQRSLVIEISAQARTDPTVKRSLRTEVRLRNDRIAYSGDTAVGYTAPWTKVCPP